MDEADARSIPGCVDAAGVLRVLRVGECEPRVVCAGGIVEGGGVVGRIVADSVSDVVKDDFYAAGMGGIDEGLELGLRAEARTELVAGAVLISVIGVGGEDGLQVDHRDAEILEIVERGGGRKAAEIAETRLGRTLHIVIGIAPGDGHDLVDDFVLRRAVELRTAG